MGLASVEGITAVQIGFGSLGLATVLLWPRVRHLKGVLCIQFVGASAFAVYYALGGAHTASACCGVSALQLLAIAALPSKPTAQKVCAVGAVFQILFAVFTWQGVISLLAIVGAVLGTTARLQTSTSRMKMGFLAAAPLWIAHNLITRSAFGLAVDIVSVSSNLLSIIARARKEGTTASAIVSAAALCGVFCLHPPRFARGTGLAFARA